MTYNTDTTTQKSEMFNHITAQMSKTYEAKNHDYGNAFGKSIEEFGLVAAVVRMNDKMERIKSLAKMCSEAQRVKDESIKDTLLDLANYAVMTLVELETKKKA